MLEQNLRVPELGEIVVECLADKPSYLAQHRLTRDFLRINTIEIIGNRLADFRDGANATYDRIPHYWTDLKREFYLLACTDDPRYDDVRQSLGGGIGKSQREISARIAAAISGRIKIADVILLPFCALCLIALAKLGRENFVATNIIDTGIGIPAELVQSPVLEPRPDTAAAPAAARRDDETMTVEQVKAWAAGLRTGGDRRGPDRLSDAEYFRILGRVRRNG